FQKAMLPFLLLLFPFVNSVHIHHMHGEIYLGIGAECRNLEGNYWHCGPGLWCGPNGVCEVEKPTEPHVDEHLDHVFTEDVFSEKQPFHEDSEHLLLDSVISPQPPSVDELLHVNADKMNPKDQLPSSYDELFQLRTESTLAKEHDSAHRWINSPTDYKTAHRIDNQDHASTNIMLDAMDYPTKREHKKSKPIVRTQHPLDDQELKSLMAVLPIIRYLFRDKFLSPTKSSKVYILSDGGFHETTVPSLDEAINDVASESSTSVHANSDSLPQVENWNEHKKFLSDDSIHPTDFESVIDNPLFMEDAISSTEQEPIFEPSSTHETHFDLHEINLPIGSNLHSDSDSTQSTTETSTSQEIHNVLVDTQLSSGTQVSALDRDFSSEHSSSVKFISTSTKDLKYSSTDEHPALPVRNKSSDGNSLSPDSDETSAVDLTPFFYDVTPTPSLGGQSSNDQLDSACSFEFIPLPFTENDKATYVVPFDIAPLSSDDGVDDGDNDVDHAQNIDIVTVMNSKTVDNDPISNSHSSMPFQLNSKTLDINSTEHVFNFNSTVTPAERSLVSSETQLPTPAPKTNQPSTFTSSPLKEEMSTLYSSNICSPLIMKLLNPLSYIRYLFS
ncbi:Protein of unknown function, partial [Gryllus bimaculatus]